jgi:molybdenum cofactor cytidylyltransferase
MDFGEKPLPAALGCILAHTLRLPGRVLHKGTILDASALQSLADAGHRHVVAARLAAGDVAEDEAARRVAQALLAAPGAEGLVRARAATGRVNLTAAHAGLFRADRRLIDALNALHEGITIGTLADATPAAAGELVATIKIIPFAVPGDALAQAECLARAAPALRVPAFRPMRAGLVMTELPGMKESVLSGTMRVTEGRIGRLGGTLLPPLRVPHATAAIAAAIARLLPQADLVLIAGASAVMDRQDEAPAAIVAAGGSIEHFGMPVDPGNLLCVGRIGAVPALVLPGCARSPALNGIDFVLRRLFAGEPAGGAEIARMGVGGLLKEFASRPMPRAVSAPARKRVAAVVLAAGLSTRMAPANKLLVPDARGIAMVARVVDNILASRAGPLVVVLGHQAEAVRDAVGSRPVRFVHAADYATGLAASLRTGIAAVPDSASAALICLGDMPLVGAPLLNRLIDTYDADEGRLIVVPTCQGRRGNPVLWDRRYFLEMAALGGDSGARLLLRSHADAVAEVETSDEAVLVDFDTPAATAIFRQ